MKRDRSPDPLQYWACVHGPISSKSHLVKRPCGAIAGAIVCPDPLAIVEALRLVIDEILQQIAHDQRAHAHEHGQEDLKQFLIEMEPNAQGAMDQHKDGKQHWHAFTNSPQR